jgi:hypothetical protein
MPKNGPHKANIRQGDSVAAAFFITWAPCTDISDRICGYLDLYVQYYDIAYEYWLNDRCQAAKPLTR